jgi:hypothetical protein
MLLVSAASMAGFCERSTLCSTTREKAALRTGAVPLAAPAFSGVYSFSLDYRLSGRKDRFGNVFQYKASVNRGMRNASDVGPALEHP